MKKLLSVLLALAMVFSLTVPAFADGPDGPPALEDLFPGWEKEQEQARNDFITAHGGTPGQINVMVNGKYLSFPAGKPAYIRDGATYVDAATLSKALGTDVSADDKGYASLRSSAQALGYDVQWDSYYNTAVITDLDALAEKIDKDFTIYNKLAAKSALTDKTQKSTGSGRADITLFDSLNGDKTGKATCSYDLAASAAGVSGKVEYDLTELWAFIKGYIPMPLDLAGADEYAKQLEMLESLMKGKAEVRVDLEKGKVYFSMPGLFEAMASEMAAAGMQLTQNAWLSASLNSEELAGLTGMMKEAPTLGKYFCSLYSMDGLGADSYDNILEAAELLAKLYGDAKFTRKGSAYVLTLTREDLAGILEPLVGQDGYTGQDLDALTKFDFTLTVKDNGDVDVSYQARVALASSGLNLGDFVDVSVKGTVRGGKTEATMEFHIKNVLKATVTLQQTVTETDTPPEVTPPKDVLVLPIDGTLGGVISSPDGPTQLVTTPTP